mmetsp:Transcript_71095/g.203742  ORF Transcript_71095/g.203742 Transcript_71095/m.203742 type:complete len:317 (-) Transcript_71095:97-1047(-)
MRDDYYELLGLTVNANSKEVARAYRKRSLQVHPDKVVAAGGDPEAAAEAFSEVREAYDVLSDAGARKRYDERNRWMLSHPHMVRWPSSSGGGSEGIFGVGGAPPSRHDLPPASASSSSGRDTAVTKSFSSTAPNGFWGAGASSPLASRRAPPTPARSSTAPAVHAVASSSTTGNVASWGFGGQPRRRAAPCTLRASLDSSLPTSSPSAPATPTGGGTQRGFAVSSRDDLFLSDFVGDFNDPAPAFSQGCDGGSALPMATSAAAAAGRSAGGVGDRFPAAAARGLSRAASTGSLVKLWGKARPRPVPMRGRPSGWSS